MVGEKCAPGEAGKMQAPGRKGAPPNNHQIEIVIKWEHAFILRGMEKRGDAQGDIVRGVGIAQEAVWLFTGCILILQDGGLDMWKPANAPRLLTSACPSLFAAWELWASRSFWKYLYIRLMCRPISCHWQKRASASGFAAAKYYSTKLPAHK